MSFHVGFNPELLAVPQNRGEPPMGFKKTLVYLKQGPQETTKNVTRNPKVAMDIGWAKKAQLSGLIPCQETPTLYPFRVQGLHKLSLMHMLLLLSAACSNT